eukprot:XP_001698153.1 predicted protein [Chlamydomonas reinhardtii]
MSAMSQEPHRPHDSAGPAFDTTADTQSLLASFPVPTAAEAVALEDGWNIDDDCWDLDQMLGLNGQEDSAAAPELLSPSQEPAGIGGLSGGGSSVVPPLIGGLLEGAAAVTSAAQQLPGGGGGGGGGAMMQQQQQLYGAVVQQRQGGMEVATRPGDDAAQQASPAFPLQLQPDGAAPASEDMVLNPAAAAVYRSAGSAGSVSCRHALETTRGGNGGEELQPPQPPQRYGSWPYPHPASNGLQHQQPTQPPPPQLQSVHLPARNGEHMDLLRRLLAAGKAGPKFWAAVLQNGDGGKNATVSDLLQPAATSASGAAGAGGSSSNAFAAAGSDRVSKGVGCLPVYATLPADVVRARNVVHPPEQAPAAAGSHGQPAVAVPSAAEEHEQAPAANGTVGSSKACQPASTSSRRRRSEKATTEYFEILIKKEFDRDLPRILNMRDGHPRGYGILNAIIHAALALEGLSSEQSSFAQEAAAITPQPPQPKLPQPRVMSDGMQSKVVALFEALLELFGLVLVLHWLLPRLDGNALTASTKKRWVPLMTAARAEHGRAVEVTELLLRRCLELGLFGPSALEAGTSVLLCDLTPFNKYYRSVGARRVLDTAMERVWRDPSTRPRVREDVQDEEQLMSLMDGLSLGMGRLSLGRDMDTTE